MHECYDEYTSLAQGPACAFTLLNSVSHFCAFQFLVYKKLQKEAEFQRQEWIRKQGKHRQGVKRKTFF